MDLYGLRRDEMVGEVVKWLQDEVELPDDEALKADVCGPLKDEDSSLRFKVETGKAMKKRGLKSPDGLMSLALTFAVPVSKVAKNLRRSAAPVNWRTV